MDNVAEIKTQHVGDELTNGMDSVPTWVVALHPDLTRIGEAAPMLGLVKDGRDYLSRNRPDFSKNGCAGRSLNDARISRSPIIMQQDSADTFRIRAHSTSTQVEIVGRAQQSEYLLKAHEMSSGVVVCLNKTVVLVLKLLPLQESWLNSDDLLKGIGPDIRAISDTLAHVAQLNIPILIRGRSGTGKERAAYTVHSRSDRQQQPFVTVNLAAIHDVVAREELFGTVKDGEYIPGYIGQAKQGTLVLEDLEDASEHIIELLYAAFSKHQYLPVNSDKQQQCDCRIIVTSVHDSCPQGANSKLWKFINSLDAYQVFLPALVDRMEDISLLFMNFVEEQWHRIYPNREFSLDVPAELISQLLVFHWPGNVRQLRNVARQVAIDSREEAKLNLDPQLLSLLRPKAATELNGNSKRSATRKPNTISREELLEALRRNRFELQATARDLRISRASVYQLIQRFDGIHTAQDLSESQLVASYERYCGDTEQMMWELEVSQVGMRRRLKAMGYDI